MPDAVATIAVVRGSAIIVMAANEACSVVECVACVDPGDTVMSGGAVVDDVLTARGEVVVRHRLVRASWTRQQRADDGREKGPSRCGTQRPP